MRDLSLFAASGATLHRGARASHYGGLSCCRAQAPDAQAQWLWRTGLVAPRHVGSSQTRARTRVPCIGRQILNHCATREAPIASSFDSIIHDSALNRGSMSYSTVSLVTRTLPASSRCSSSVCGMYKWVNELKCSVIYTCLGYAPISHTA